MREREYSVWMSKKKNKEFKKIRLIGLETDKKT